MLYNIINYTKLIYIFKSNIDINHFIKSYISTTRIQYNRVMMQCRHFDDEVTSPGHTITLFSGFPTQCTCSEILTNCGHFD